MMRAVVWSVVVTAAAAGLLGLAGQAADLRVAGVAGGGIVALVGLSLGILAPGARRKPTAEAVAAPLPRFFGERRRAVRRRAETAVRVSVDGHAYPALLLNVSSNGALLRLPPHVARRLQGEVGAPVRIEGHPAGSVARVGACGLYVDFAVQFTPRASRTAAPPSSPTVLSSIPPRR
jgi:hypothetical protein